MKIYLQKRTKSRKRYNIYRKKKKKKYSNNHIDIIGKNVKDEIRIKGKERERR